MDHIKNRPNPLDEPVSFSLPDPNLLGELTPWEVDFRQLEPGPMQTDIRVRSGHVLTLLEISMNRAVHQTGRAPRGSVSLGIPLSNRVERWNGAGAPEASVLSFGADDGFEGVNGDGFHGITFSASLEGIARLCDRSGIALPETALTCGVVSPAVNNPLIRHIANRSLGTLTGRSGQTFANDEDDILLALLTSLSDYEKNADRSVWEARSRAVRVALDFMAESASENPALSEICGATGVSLRTLNRAFRERFGLGPKAYFLKLRLNRMRRDLLFNRGERAISDIANDWGFWHLGQLARDYRVLFGELPSETDRRQWH